MSITKYEMPDGGFEASSQPWDLRNNHPVGDLAFFAKRALSDDAYNHINNLISKKWAKGSIGADGVENTKIRNSDVIFLKNSEENEQKFWDEITQLIHNVNNYHYHFDLSAIQTLQLTRYEAPMGHYDWHVDVHSKPYSNGMIRKLSFTILLNDEFEGGNFDIWHGHPISEKSEVKSYALKKGEMIVFPSHTWHKVNKVTKGIRKALVGWVVGKQWK